MFSKRFRLTPEVQGQIVSSIRAGGYPHVAAEAWGVPKSVFEDWIKRAARDKAREPYRSFGNEVRAAHAQARLRAEIEIYQADPKCWLVHGPGRETAAGPGWSVLVKPAAAEPEDGNVLFSGAVMALFQVVIKTLEPFPEARVLVAKVISKLGAAPIR